MSNWQDPRRQAGRDLAWLFIGLGLILILLSLLAAVSPFSAKAQSPEPFWAPKGTLVGSLFISDGENLDTLYGAILFMPGEATGTLLVYGKDKELHPMGEVTITYWVEPTDQ